MQRIALFPEDYVLAFSLTSPLDSSEPSSLSTVSKLFDN